MPARGKLVLPTPVSCTSTYLAYPHRVAAFHVPSLQSAWNMLHLPHVHFPRQHETFPRNYPSNPSHFLKLVQRNLVPVWPHQWKLTRLPMKPSTQRFSPQFHVVIHSLRQARQFVCDSTRRSLPLPSLQLHLVISSLLQQRPVHPTNRPSNRERLLHKLGCSLQLLLVLSFLLRRCFAPAQPLR